MRSFFTHKALVIWLLGVMSGFTLMISGNTLNYWLSEEQINIKTIGLFAFILLPYSINFIWAPIFDTIRIKFISNLLGDRLGWIFITQFALIISIVVLSTVNPHKELLKFGFFALFVAFLSSTQDSLLGALKTEIVTKKEQGEFAGLYIFGYRIGMLISGSGAIYLSSFISFDLIYKYMAAIIFVQNIILVILVKRFNLVYANNSISARFNKPFSKISSNPVNIIAELLRPIGSTTYLILIIIFLILYRLPDNFINMMINPFLLSLKFDAEEIASVGKFFGVLGAIIGGFAASYIMQKKAIIDSLFIFGAIHAFAHILLIVQSSYDKNIYMLFLTISAESITGGMTMAAYIAYIASLCSGKFRATQYSFFSAMMGFSRAILPAISGYIVSICGWKIFFLLSSFATIPSLILLSIIKKHSQP